ncbi:MAG: hypothetical protein LBU09_04270 [Endomicrobium sp.]|nr:hypothetical protein [Endomicrobium sp.]
MKKMFAAAVLIAFASVGVFAHPYEAFNIVMSRSPYLVSLGANTDDSVADKKLDKFASNVGQAIGGGSFGNSFGLTSFGFNLSIKMSYQQVGSEDAIVNKNGDTAIYYPIIQGEFSVFENLTSVARFSYSNDSFVFGGGFKYKLNDGYGYIPTLSVQSIYNYLIADIDDVYKFLPKEIYNYDRIKFNAWNLKNAVMAFFPETPYVKPYVFLSYDITGLHAITSDRAGASSIVSGIGYGAGGTISLDPVNLNFTISMYDGSPNYNFGIFFGF